MIRLSIESAAVRLAVTCPPHRYVPHVRTDNFRIAPFDALQVDVFRAFVETVPAKGEK